MKSKFEILKSKILQLDPPLIRCIALPVLLGYVVLFAWLVSLRP